MQSMEHRQTGFPHVPIDLGGPCFWPWPPARSRPFFCLPLACADVEVITWPSSSAGGRGHRGQQELGEGGQVVGAHTSLVSKARCRRVESELAHDSVTGLKSCNELHGCVQDSNVGVHRIRALSVLWLPSGRASVCHPHVSSLAVECSS